MSANEPIKDLNSRSPSDRADAAGWLVQHPEQVSSRELMQALQAESVPRIRQLLLRVLELRQNPQPQSAPSPRELEHPDQTANYAPTPDLAALIRHELSPAVGWIRLAADQEISHYSSSQTHDAVRKLQRRIDGLVTLIKSGEDLNLRRFSLTELLQDNWPDPQHLPVLIAATGPAVVEIETDEGLIALLLSNVYQNALDAAADSDAPMQVRVTWGYTELNYWVRITNSFRGERFSFGDVLAVGASSKIAHQGQGLSLIQTAASLLKIAVSLEGQSGMASFSLSGSRPHD